MLTEKEGSAVHLRSVWVEDIGAFYEQVLSLLALLVQKQALMTQKRFTGRGSPALLSRQVLSLLALLVQKCKY
jgi:hypothetical protein